MGEIASRTRHVFAGAERRDNLDRGKLRALIGLCQSRAEPLESDLQTARVTRGKVSVRLTLVSGLKGRATPIRKDALYWSACNAKVWRVAI